MFHIDHLSKCNRLSHLNSQIWKSRNQIWKTRQNFSFQKSLPRLGFGSLVLLPFNPFCPACYLHWRWIVTSIDVGWGIRRLTCAVLQWTQNITTLLHYSINTTTLHLTLDEWGIGRGTCALLHWTRNIDTTLHSSWRYMRYWRVTL